jgi:hypothetical protein
MKSLRRMSVSSEMSGTDPRRGIVSMCSFHSAKKLKNLSCSSCTEEDSSPEIRDGVRRCDFWLKPMF